LIKKNKMKRREIKFRGIPIDKEKFIYGFLNRPFDDITQIIEKIPSNASQMTLIVNGSEGQFTGLLDVNGREIYEGDIVDRVSFNGISDFGEVVYSENSFVIIPLSKSISGKSVNFKKCRVMNNIYGLKIWYGE
jgi:hypothetical protein